MKVKEFLARYDAGEEFNEKELQEIFGLTLMKMKMIFAALLKKSTVSQVVGPAIIPNG